jgi:alpha-L-rhamnosidase
MWAGKGYNYGDTPPALKAQLRVEHTDGSVEWISTDQSWRADISPILKSEIYDGESYDARHVQPGWDTAQFSDTKWNPVFVLQPHEPAIIAQYFQPIREEKTLTARSITTPKPGVYVYDFGQDLAGVARLRVQGAAGTDVRLRFAEILNPDGTLYTENLRTAKATDRYILAGKGVEEYQPHFTFHGFRYVELTGLGSKPDLTAVKAVVFHTDAPFSTQLQTGSPMINQLWSNIVWGQRSNFIGVPTDCPQRDERLGWTGDAQVFWRTASYNMGLAAFSRKFTADLRGTQTGTDMYGIFAPGTVSSSAASAAGWSDAGVIIPWTAWLQYGDARVAEQNWSAMERYLSAIEKGNPDYLWKNNFGIPFGDWLAPTERTSEAVLATALWAYDVSRMQQMARALHRDAEEQKYRELFAKITAAFDKAYVHDDGFIEAVDPTVKAARPPGAKPETDTKAKDTQTAYVLALYMKLLPDELRAKAAEKLVSKIEARNWTLGTGFLGTPYLLEALTDTGHTDVAYRLLLGTAFPSWGYMVQHGATTMWERWNGDQMLDDPGMNSFNHYAYGAVGEWLYRYVAGIDADPEDPGFHHIILHPNFDARFGSMAATYDSAYGPIKSEWKDAANVVHWTIVIPPNTKALAIIPAGEKATILEGGKAMEQNQWLSFVRKNDGLAVYEVQPGSYAFTISQ